MSFSGMKSAVRRAIEKYEPIALIERTSTSTSNREETLLTRRTLALSNIGQQMSNALPLTSDWALRALASASNQPCTSIFILFLTFFFENEKSADDATRA